MLDSSPQRSHFRRKLLAWFDRHQRDLPWRKERTPYRIWVSEIMLQQTQVATVIDYYLRFMKAFPDVQSLARAKESRVLKLWEGLGYYRRARQLHAAAKVICEKHGGVFPETVEDVLALPGVGRYTAGAVLSISLDQRLPILEGNTQRLFARLMLLEEDPKASASQRAMWSFSESLLPRKRCGDFNQALMELGSLICQPKSPGCLLCPVANHCAAFANGKQDQIPVASRKMKYENLHEAVLLLRRRRKGIEEYLVRLCGEGERWQGMWDFPRYPIDAADNNVVEQLGRAAKNQLGIEVEIGERVFSFRHAVTKYRISVDVYNAIGTGRVKKSKAGEAVWGNAADLELLPMSAPARKITKMRPKSPTGK